MCVVTDHGLTPQIRPASDAAAPDPRHTAFDVVTLMNPLSRLTRAVALIGTASALVLPTTPSAHPGHAVQTVATTASWDVVVMLTSLATFAFIIGAATVWRVVMHRRQPVPGPRTQTLLTSAMA